MRSLIATALLFGTLGVAAPARENEPIHIDVGSIPKQSRALLGRPLITHGCLSTNIHGDAIQPCQSHDWRELTLVLDPGYKIVGAALKKVASNQIEADFLGTLIERDADWPEPHKQIYLRLDSISNVQRHEP